MISPNPEDLGPDAIWEMYAVDRLVAASVGQIPRNALAMGILLSGRSAKIIFLLRSCQDDDREDIESITSDFLILTEDAFDVSSEFRMAESRSYNWAGESNPIWVWAAHD